MCYHHFGVRTGPQIEGMRLPSLSTVRHACDESGAREEGEDKSIDRLAHNKAHCSGSKEAKRLHHGHWVTVIAQA